jgi:tRNA(Ile)-lysidine synthase
MPPSLIERVHTAIRAHRLIAPHDRVLVAVSGGADSVALLHLLLAIRERSGGELTLHVGHLDHALREGSRDDAAFVRELAQRWQLPATIERQDVGTICRREKISVEDGARRIRYDFFQRLTRREGLTRVAVAHTADDQAETVLLRIMRGSGLAGLGAIPVQRPLTETGDERRETRNEGEGVTLIRPLLEVWRAEVAAYLQEEGVSHREDPTNANCRVTRNRVRHQLLPLLERDYNPNIKQALTQLAQQSGVDYAYLQQAAMRQWGRTIKVAAPERLAIRVQAFLRQPKAIQRQLARRAVTRVKAEDGELEFRHWLEIERVFFERPVGTILDLPGGVRLRREAEWVVCERDRQRG